MLPNLELAVAPRSLMGWAPKPGHAAFSSRDSSCLLLLHSRASMSGHGRSRRCMQPERSPPSLHATWPAPLAIMQDSKHFSIIIELPNTNPPRYLHTGIAIASITTAFILYALEVRRTSP